jgi:hypothetical protein
VEQRGNKQICIGIPLCLQGPANGDAVMLFGAGHTPEKAQ